MNNVIDEKMIAMLDQYRKEHFRVQCGEDKWHPGELVLSVTHNGNQWQSVALLPREIPSVIEALQTALTKSEKGKL